MAPWLNDGSPIAKPFRFFGSHLHVHVAHAMRYNRDGITCLTVPAPPLERPKDFKELHSPGKRLELKAGIFMVFHRQAPEHPRRLG